MLARLTIPMANKAVGPAHLTISMANKAVGPARLIISITNRAVGLNASPVSPFIEGDFVVYNEAQTLSTYCCRYCTATTVNY
jgi:hypothetical protein